MKQDGIKQMCSNNVKELNQQLFVFVLELNSLFSSRPSQQLDDRYTTNGLRIAVRYVDPSIAIGQVACAAG